MSEEFSNFGRWFAFRVRQHLNKLELNPETDHLFGFNSNCLEVLGIS